jgi:hypothetical protein
MQESLDEKIHTAVRVMNYGLLAEFAVLYCRSKFSEVTDANSLVTAASALICRTNDLCEKVEAAVDQVPEKLTFRGPFIVIYSYNKTNEMH